MPFPQVLLLGNGLNRAYSKDSWNDFLKSCSCLSEEEYDQLCSPMPLRAIVATNNSVYSSITQQKKDLIGQTFSNDYLSVLQGLISSDIDQIITTNYTYELETAAINKDYISEYCLKKASTFIPDKAINKVESKYLIRSYNKFLFKNQVVNVWHIHGEIRKPNSVVLGHYNYSALLSKMKGFSELRGDYYLRKQKSQKDVNYKSWIDYFIMGDIYVLGFGFDFSEFDLWWLINRKFNEKANHGKIIIFEPEHCDGETEKERLLKLFGAEFKHCGIKIPKAEEDGSNKNEIDSKYFEFYERAIKEIKELTNSKRRDNHGTF